MLRRMLTRWLSIAMAATAFALVASPTAHALEPCQALGTCALSSTPLASQSHVGWVYLNLNYCPPGMMCAAVHRVSAPAWRWTGTRWVQASINGGWVYVYPYSSPWRWAWTQHSGWVAISGGRFEIRRY